MGHDSGVSGGVWCGELRGFLGGEAGHEKGKDVFGNGLSSVIEIGGLVCRSGVMGIRMTKILDKSLGPRFARGGGFEMFAT